MPELKPIYIPGYIEASIASQEFQRLWDHLDWDMIENVPRREYWQNNYNLAYTYGRGVGTRTYECKPWDDFILAVMERINTEFDFLLDCCFVNGYGDERDSLGWHADDSPEMNPAQPVLSLSFGAERDIKFRNNETREISTVRLGHGSLMIMPAGFQQTHQHKIPKGDRPCGPRVSLTYRGMVLL